MEEPEPQAVLAPITESAIFLVAAIRAGAEEPTRDFLEDVNGLRRSVGFRIPEAELSCVVGIGASLWDRLFGEQRPAGLHPFREQAGAKHTAVATDGDLLFHIRAHRMDLCFELAQRIMMALGEHASAVDEVHGFRSFDERDLLGFVDGTESPEGAAAGRSAFIGDEDPAFAGGSYVLVQKYIHDLDAWESLPIPDQEAAIGRTKLSDIEFPDDQKALNSHVALNTIVDEDGRQQQIMRFNMPFGSVATKEFGTYFIGYARTPDVLEEMLANMFVGKPEGNYDRILDFSRPLTGSLYFVPTSSFLDEPVVREPAPEQPDKVGPLHPPLEGSLEIGGLSARDG
jgi:putative iron-dependent peroxidase